MLRAIEALEPVLAEIPERQVGRHLVDPERVRRARDQHLATMGGGADPRGAVDVQAYVVVLPDDRLAGVNAHAYAHLESLGPVRRAERPLRANRGGERVARARKRDEEGVALGVDFVAIVTVEGCAQ